MEEKSNIDVLEEYARSTNREIVHKKKPYPLTGIRTFRKYKQYVYIPYNNIERNNFYIWFSDPYATVGYYTVFSGAFIPISSRIKGKINIRSKNVIDKVNVFSKSKAIKIGSSNFDSKAVITGTMDSAAKKLLSQAKIQEQFLNALELPGFLNISINEYDINFVPELKGKSYLSIINPKGWDFEKDTIEDIFRIMKKIRNIISIQ